MNVRPRDTTSGAKDALTSCRRTTIARQGPTPGPWTIERVDYPKGQDVSFEIVAGSGLDTVAQTLMRDVATEADRIASDEANARLIAAAPDLLAALKTIQSNRASHEAAEPCASAKCGDCGHEIGWPVNSFAAPICEDCVIAAALAKAEGRTV